METPPLPHKLIRWTVEGLLLTACVLVLRNAGGCMIVRAQTGWLPPMIEMANDFHCAVSPTPYGYTARAEVSYLNHSNFKREPWHLVLAIFAPKGSSDKAKAKAELEAVKVCIAWKDSALKAQHRKFQELNEFPKVKGLKVERKRQDG